MNCAAAIFQGNGSADGIGIGGGSITMRYSRCLHRRHSRVARDCGRRSARGCYESCCGDSSGQWQRRQYRRRRVDNYAIFKIFAPAAFTSRKRLRASLQPQSAGAMKSRCGRTQQQKKLAPSRSRVFLRYRLCAGGREEDHRSSGVIVIVVEQSALPSTMLVLVDTDIDPMRRSAISPV